MCLEGLLLPPWGCDPPPHRVTPPSHLLGRLQAVMCIISTIMESCPSTSSFYSSATKTQHNGMNNIIRLFLKKGLVNDLARVPHSLDLSRYRPTGSSRGARCGVGREGVARGLGGRWWGLEGLCRVLVELWWVMVGFAGVLVGS